VKRRRDGEGEGREERPRHGGGHGETHSRGGTEAPARDGGEETRSQLHPAAGLFDSVPEAGLSGLSPEAGPRIYQANGSIAKPMAPRCAESSDPARPEAGPSCHEAGPTLSDDKGYRGTSLIRNSDEAGPRRAAMLRVCGSGARFEFEEQGYELL